MSAISEQVAAELAQQEGGNTDWIQQILEAGEKAFMREFDKHLDLVLFKKKILLWSITIKLGDLRPQVVAIWNKLTPGALVV